MATATPLNISQEFRIDHENIKDLHARYQTSSSSDVEEKLDLKLPIVNTLVREIVMHLEASEMTLYRVLKEKGMSARALEVDQQTHARIMTLAATLDAARTLNPVSFDALVNDAVNAFSDHAKEKEKVRLPQLELLITQEENTKLTLDFLKARATVPTRPHIHAPHTGGSAERVALAAGKAMDSLYEGFGKKKEYVEVAHRHASI